MNNYSQEGLIEDVSRSEAGHDSLQTWWEDAHRRDHEFWLSGTSGEEVWARLGIRDRLSSGVTVLNIGVGLGRCTRALAALGCDVSVLDISVRALERVSEVANGWIHPEDLPTDRFDIALSHLVVQHMTDIELQDQLTHVIRSLRPHGLYAFQYLTGADGQRSPQYRSYAKSGAIRRRPEDIANLVAQCGGRLAAHFQRETKEDGNVWWVAQAVRADSGIPVSPDLPTAPTHMVEDSRCLQGGNGTPAITIQQYEKWLKASRIYGEKVRRTTVADGTFRYSASWCDLDQLGRSETSYRRTYSFDGPYLDEYHRSLAESPLGRMGIPFCIDLGIDGYLTRAEAQKLYELARCTNGDVLELGTYRGLSASIIASGLRSRGTGHLWTIDLEKEASAAAETALAERLLSNFVTFIVGDAPVELDRLVNSGGRFGFVFVDHSHTYEATADAISRLPQALAEGGFVLFHDFNDPTNADLQSVQKVYPAVIDHLAFDERFEFYGIFSSAALFRRIR